MQKLDKLLDDPDFNSDSFAINETESSVDVMAGDIMVTSITPKEPVRACRLILEKSTTCHLVQAPMIDVRLVPGGESSAKL